MSQGLPRGKKVCRNSKCGQLIAAALTKACPHCGVVQGKKLVAETPKSKGAFVKVGKAAKPTKPVKVSVPLEPVVQVVPDPFTFSVNTPNPRITGKAAGPLAKYPPEIIRNTAHLNPVLGVLAHNGTVMVKDVDKRSQDMMEFANGIEIPSTKGDYNADLIPVVLADEGFEDSDNPAYAPYIDRVDVPRYAVK